MKRLAPLLMLVAVAACGDDPTGPSEPPPDTGIQIENATGTGLTVRVNPCVFDDAEVARITIGAGRTEAVATEPGCWRLDGYASDDRYAFDAFEVDTGELREVRFRSADSDDLNRFMRLIIEVQD